MKAYVLKEVESGKCRSQNLFVKDDSYHRKLINASIYETHEEAKYQADSLNRMSEGFVEVVEIELKEN